MNSLLTYSETPASFYPFTAVIPEGGEGFENGDWIEIAITVGYGEISVTVAAAKAPEDQEVTLSSSPIFT